MNNEIQVVSYIRESTRGQSLHGYRPATQRKGIERYCRRHNFKIVKEYQDSGSGKDITKRPSFVQMVKLVKNNPSIRFIVVYDTSRFFRDVQGTLTFEKELENQYGVFAVDTCIDSNPREYLVNGIGTDQWSARIHARTNAERERREIQTRVKEGYEEKSSYGQYVGPLAFGLEWKDDHHKFIGYNEEKASIVREVFRLYKTGEFGFTKLARHLNERHFSMSKTKLTAKTVGGTEVLHRKTEPAPFTLDALRSIISNKSYIGRQNTPPYKRLQTLGENDEKYDLTPLISEYEYNQVQKVVTQNKRGNKRAKKTSRQRHCYILQGIGYSAVNGERLHAQTENALGIRRYIACTNKKGNLTKIPSIRADEVEAKLVELLKMVKINNIETIEDILRNVIEFDAKQPKSTTTNSVELKSLLNAIKALREADKYNPTVQTEALIFSYESKINEMKSLASSPKRDGLVYYDMKEIRAALCDIANDFKELQSMAAKEELLKILFSTVYIAGNKTKELIYSKRDFEEIKDQAQAKSSGHFDEAMELGEKLKRFVPALFEKIYVKKEKNIVHFDIQPTGLFLLLADPDVDHYNAVANEAGGLKKTSLCNTLWRRYGILPCPPEKLATD